MQASEQRLPDTRRVVIHIDVDCFYAQVEELRNPTLQGKPLAVTQKYLCVTTNYAARAKGVAKMMGLKEAVAVCPELQLVSGEDLTPYRAASKQILGVLAEFGTVERLGMDEAVIDATDAADRLQRGQTTQKWRGHVFRGNGEQLRAESHRRPMDLRDTGTRGALNEGDSSGTVVRDEAEERLACGSAIAYDLRRAVRERVGYACCCGIAHNKLLAKIACGLHKPDNQTSLPAAHACTVMGPLPVRVINGVGYKTGKTLDELGIRTVAELRSLVVCGGGTGGGQLVRAVGPKLAAVLAEACWGRDASPVMPRGPPKSITVEDSFRRCKSFAEVKLVLQRLAPDLIERIREEAQESNRLPSTLTVAWRRGPEFLPDGTRRKRTKSSRTSRSVSLPPLPHPFHAAAQSAASPPWHTDTADGAASGFVEAALAVLRAELGTTSYNLTLLNLGAANFKPWVARRATTATGAVSSSVAASPRGLIHSVTNGQEAHSVSMSKADTRLYVETTLMQRHNAGAMGGIGARSAQSADHDDASVLFGSDDWDDCGIVRGHGEENGGNASDLDDDESFWESLRDCGEEVATNLTGARRLSLESQNELSAKTQQEQQQEQRQQLPLSSQPQGQHVRAAVVSDTPTSHSVAAEPVSERKKSTTPSRWEWPASARPRQRQKTLDAFLSRS